MTPYTQSEVFRTARPYVETNAGSVGNGLSHGVNEACICCKSPANPIPSAELMEPFKQFYKTLEHKAYQCPACGYMFSWYKPKE